MAQQNNSSIEEIKSYDHFSSIMAGEFDNSQNKRYMVVDFYGTSCPPCIQFAPTYEKLATIYGDKVHFTKCDINKVGELACDNGVKNIPTFAFFEMGDDDEKQLPNTQIVGAKTAEEGIIKVLNKLVGEPNTSSVEPTGLKVNISNDF
jgi:thiol-disulfide isomerase/thioredoxin